MAKVLLYFNVTNVIIFISICIGFQALASLDCNFEDGFCGWQQDNSDDFDWLRQSKYTSTWTSGTGPSSDHTTGDDGHYIYIEASGQNEGDQAILSSQVQEPGTYCLTFWYNMYGRDIGTLNVYMKLNGGSRSLILTKDRNLGHRDWRKAVINTNATYRYQIVFEGVQGDGWEGDIALDDISIIPGLCSVDCDYDSGLCNWMQDDDYDAFDWTLWKGPTQTSDTGPEADHTSGNGQYVYIDSSEENEADIALLVSPLQNAGKHCFSFWYYMNGEDVDSLRVVQWYDQGKLLEVFKERGDKGQKWLQKQLFLNSSTNFKGRVKDDRSRWHHDKGDIAIDDVKMLTCEDCENPTPSYAVTSSTNFEYGSVIKITCIAGYNLIGESLFVCQAGGTWNASQPSCKPFNCGNRTIPNGKFIAPEGTTFGQTAKHVCSIGYSVKGDAAVPCTATGWNSTTATCKIVAICFVSININKYTYTRYKLKTSLRTVCSADCGNREIPNGKFVATDGTTFGQTASQVCNKGYTLIGDTDVICTSTGWNSTVATCTIVDCGDRTISNGKFIALGGTTFGQTATHVCNIGYILVGDATVSCTGTGWNRTSAACKIVDCGNREIPNGTFVAVDGTTFGQTASQVCNKGYTLIGDTDVICTSTGWNDTVATCTIVDCGNRTVLNGKFVAPEGTTFRQTATHVCNIGYTLVGDTTVTCTSSGWKGTGATCESVDAGNGALIAVYVVVPVIVVLLAVLLAVICLRRRLPACKKMTEDKHESHKTPIMSFSNTTYAGPAVENQNQTNYSYTDAALEVDNEYAIITDDHQNKNKDISDTVYYNTVGDAVTFQEDGSHDYDHTKNTAAHFVDDSYSHLLDNKTGTTFEPSYNTTLDLDSGNSPRKQAQSDIYSYNVLNNCKGSINHRNEIEERTESDYDHAHAGGIDPVALDENDYSHLNDKSMKRKCPEPLVRGNQDKFEYSSVNENIREKVKTVEKPKAGYEQPIGQKPQNFALDTENQDKIEDDRHYFVLEAEEACDENHDYYVLEKI